MTSASTSASASRSPTSDGLLEATAQAQTLASFDWQWAHLPAGDFMPGDRWFDENAARLLARELCGIDPAWFRGKVVLDAGCGQGRWSRALLELGAKVLAVDFSESGLARTRAVCHNHPELRTRRVDLLDLPTDLAAERFDFVFSFGVLHHTGNTWRALENIATLVNDSGAMFLYLYGRTSWNEAERNQIEEARKELAPLGFDEKVTELRRRYPALDPHQLFDLMSPAVNDRVSFDEVAERLHGLGFSQVTQTITHGEVYLRASRPGFPRSALLQPVGAESEFLHESTRRWLRRAGAAFEMSLRSAVAALSPREPPRVVWDILARWKKPERVVDAGLPVDRLGRFADRRIRSEESASPAVPGALAGVAADLVLSIGGTLGACRYPEEFLMDLWRATDREGLLLVELPDGIATQRTLIDRVRDARRAVPEKVASMLRRNPRWCSAHALHAVGGNSLLNPLRQATAVDALTRAGAEEVRVHPARSDTVLLEARRA